MIKDTTLKIGNIQVTNTGEIKGNINDNFSADHCYDLDSDDYSTLYHSYGSIEFLGMEFFVSIEMKNNKVEFVKLLPSIVQKDESRKRRENDRFIMLSELLWNHFDRPDVITKRSFSYEFGEYEIVCGKESENYNDGILKIKKNKGIIDLIY